MSYPPKLWLSSRLGFRGVAVTMMAGALIGRIAVHPDVVRIAVACWKEELA